VPLLRDISYNFITGPFASRRFTVIQLRCFVKLFGLVGPLNFFTMCSAKFPCLDKDHRTTAGDWPPVYLPWVLSHSTIQSPYQIHIISRTSPTLALPAPATRSELTQVPLSLSLALEAEIIMPKFWHRHTLKILPMCLLGLGSLCQIHILPIRHTPILRLMDTQEPTAFHP
jgi:hypothetical protein